MYFSVLNYGIHITLVFSYYWVIIITLFNHILISSSSKSRFAKLDFLFVYSFWQREIFRYVLLTCLIWNALRIVSLFITPFVAIFTLPPKCSIALLFGSFYYIGKCSSVSSLNELSLNFFTFFGFQRWNLIFWSFWILSDEN